MRQVPIVIIPSQAAATITSAQIPAEYLFSISAQVVASGGGGGTLKVQASDDFGQVGNFQASNWSDISGATVTVTGNGAFLIPKTEICYRFVRLVYTNTGTGTVSVNFNGWGIS
jgi:hypothetical protein